MKDTGVLSPAWTELPGLSLILYSPSVPTIGVQLACLKKERKKNKK
jgi:hypothetical protein